MSKIAIKAIMGRHRILIGSISLLVVPSLALAVTFQGGVTISGDLNIVGSVSKGSSSFVIDHPLDPHGKLLYHSVVESPDAKNIYDGVATLNEAGEAAVELPEYMEALNGDFRYQYTAVGAPAPNLHIKEEVENNRFTIAGGEPGMRVSWQVTGIRHDPYIEAYPIQTEVEKGPDALVEKGEYLFPELTEEYGSPGILRSIWWAITGTVSGFLQFITTIVS